MKHDITDLVLVPGLNNTSAVFDGVCRALPETVRAHALDNPALDSVDAIAQALLPALPERFWLAGFSFGGYVALAMLAAAPERVQGFAMICTAPFADSPEQAQKRRAALEIDDEATYLKAIAAQTPNAFHPDSLGNQALMQARQHMVKTYGLARYRAHVQATIGRPNRIALLDGERPTLVVAASHDRVFSPDTMGTWARNIPAARFEIIQDAGHLLPMEQPHALAHILSGWMGAR